MPWNADTVIEFARYSQIERGRFNRNESINEIPVIDLMDEQKASLTKRHHVWDLMPVT